MEKWHWTDMGSACSTRYYRCSVAPSNSSSLNSFMSKASAPYSVSPSPTPTPIRRSTWAPCCSSLQRNSISSFLGLHIKNANWRYIKTPSPPTDDPTSSGPGLQTVDATSPTKDYPTAFAAMPPIVCATGPNLWPSLTSPAILADHFSAL